MICLSVREIKFPLTFPLSDEYEATFSFVKLCWWLEMEKPSPCESNSLPIYSSSLCLWSILMISCLQTSIQWVLLRSVLGHTDCYFVASFSLYSSRLAVASCYC